ncbi:MAG: CHAT domain-containing protein [Saprospiraceae bacterium]|nr:CHAT domain-containing protein [Saprospiraceae bacterium]
MQKKSNLKLNPFFSAFRVYFSLCISIVVFNFNLSAQDNLKTLSFDELDSLMNIEYLKGHYSKAIPYMITGRDKAIAEFGEVDTLVAKYNSGLGFFYTQVGEYDKAEQTFLTVKKIRAQIIGTDHIDYATTINNLAHLYLRIGTYKKAEALFLEAKEIRKKVWGEEHPEYATSLHNLAMTYKYMGRYKKVEDLYLKAKNIRAKTLGEKHPDYAVSLNNLAVLYYNLGNYKKAEVFYLQCKNIESETLGVDHPHYATGLNNLAALYMNMGENVKAESLFLESQKIRLKALGTQHPDYAASLNNLAMFYEKNNAYQKAELYALESNVILKNILGEDHLSYAINLNNLAALYVKMQRYKKAEELFFKANNIKYNIYGNEHPGYVTGLNNLALLYRKTGELDKAYELCLQGIDFNCVEIDSTYKFLDFSELIGFEYYSFPQMSTLLKTLLSVLKDQYELNGNRQILKKRYTLAKVSIQLNEQFRNELINEKDKLRVVSSSIFFIRHGIESAKLLRKDEYIQEAFSFAEFNKSMLLSDAVKGNRAYNIGDLPDDLIDYEISLQNKFSELKQQEYEYRNSKVHSEILRELSGLQIDIDLFLDSIRHEYPKYHALKYASITAKASEVQNLLDEESVFLEYLITDTIVYLFSITKDNIDLFQLDVDTKELKEKIGLLRNALTSYVDIVNGKPKVLSDYTSTAYWFYQNFLDIALTNKSYKNLIIVTDGELGHLPFETFLSKPSKQEQDYATLSYLVNDYNISYNYSATLWKENILNTNTNNNRRIIAFAADYPDIDSSLLKIRFIDDYNLRRSLMPLEATREEVQSLSKKYLGEFLFNEDANENYFKEKASDYAVIHLAMHGVFDPRRPIMSSLAFTENYDTLEDNFLQAHEISKQQLNADMVVLSACETGYGRFEQGEGIISLARSFMYAGAPSLVVSLWQVNDVSTALIMKSFYDNLANGMNKAQALRQAKLFYIRNSDGIAAHPAFWSPFIQLGDSRPIYLKTKVRTWRLYGIVGLGFILLIVIYRIIGRKNV